MPNQKASTNPLDLVARCYAYIFMGFLICCANGLAGIFFSLFMKNWKQYFRFIMLCGAETINGIQYFVTGVGRLIVIDSNLMNTTISSWDCLVHRPWVILALLGGQLPAAFHTCLAMERVIAVYWSVHYASMKHFTVKIRLTIFSLVTVGIAVLTAILITFYTPVMNRDQQCNLRIIGNGWYGTIQFTVVAVLYVIDLLVMSWVLLLVSTKRSKANRQERRRHVIVTLMSLVSVLAISLPSLSTFLYQFGIEVGEVLTLFIFGAPGIPPTLNPILYFFCIPSYRKKLTALFCSSSDQSIRARVINVASSVNFHSKSGSITRF